MPETVDSEVLVIGSGISGLRAVTTAARQCNAVLVSADGIGAESASLTPLPPTLIPARYMDVPTTVREEEFFIQESLESALGQANEKLVQILAKQARFEFHTLETLGIKFEPGAEGLRRVVGCFSRRPRCYILLDLRDLRLVLMRQLRLRGIRTFERTVVTKLVIAGDRFAGAVGVNAKGETVTFRARACILAAGGLGGLFTRSLVPASLVGSSYVLAQDAGATVKNLHLVEFLIAKPEAPPKPQKRKFAGELKLLDSKHKDLVVEQYPDAKEMERATDARAEHYAFSLHDGSGRIDAAIFRAAERGGCWMSSRSEHAPVHMFARVCNGGIAVDERGRTGIEGLFACGEAATGMHGAIRLGGEYLTSALVFGNLAGRSAVDFARGSKPSDAPLAQEEPLNASQGLGEGELENYGKMIREAVSAKAMVIRTRADLQGALGVIQVAEGVVKTKGCRDQAALAAWHQTRHMAACAKMLLEQALAQTESLGPHMIE